MVVATGQADKLLADAEKAYARGDYPKCIDYSTRAEDMAARAEKEDDKVKAALTRAESTIQSISHKGVSVAVAEALLAEAEKLAEKAGDSFKCRPIISVVERLRAENARLREQLTAALEARVSS